MAQVRPASATPPARRSTVVPVPADPTVPGTLDALAAAALRGDPAATDALIAGVRPLALQYCRARTAAHADAHTAEDLAQEVCLAVVTALPTYRPRGRPFCAFVYGIAAHKIADMHRRGARRRCTPVADVPEAPSAAAGPEHRALADERTRRLRRLLDALPSGQRDVLVLRAAMGLSAEETSRVLGIRPGAVRVSQHRAMLRLRAQSDRLRDF